MKAAAVVVLLLVSLAALVPKPVSASVVAQLEVEGEQLVAPGVFPFNLGTQPLGNISTLFFNLCFQQASSPPGSCDRGGTVNVVKQFAAPFYFAGAFRETVSSGARTPVTLPVTLAPGQRLVFVDQWLTDRLGNVADTQRLRAQATGSPADDIFLDFMGSGVSPGDCDPDPWTVCLNNNRFKVQGHFLTATASSGAANTVKLTSDTGYLTFFNPANVEVVVKVLNACGVNNRYWVFLAGLTDVRTVVTVTDTQEYDSWGYHSLLGYQFLPNYDTAAFATCP